MAFIGYSERVCDGDTAIVYLGNNASMPLKIKLGTVSQTRRGALRHADIIGTKYGCRIQTLSDKGYVYLLHPTPELWTLNLSHRTQILYFADISLITVQLELKPGAKVVESGTGSGSVSHAFARTIAPTGHLYTFEFHEQRATKAKEDFDDHNISNLITVTHRDVLEDGFNLDIKVDAVFLDLPSPWKAVPHAKKVLKTSGGRFCSFSPCIEQVQRTCEQLASLGFSNISTFECLLRSFENRTVLLPPPNLGKPAEPASHEVLGFVPDNDITTSSVDQVSDVPRTGKGDGIERESESSLSEAKKPRIVQDHEIASSPSKTQETIPDADVTSKNASFERDEIAVKDKRGNKLNYPTRCAVPVKEMSGHTGFLTFASLYVFQEEAAA